MTIKTYQLNLIPKIGQEERKTGQNLVSPELQRKWPMAVFKHSSLPSFGLAGNYHDPVLSCTCRTSHQEEPG